MNLTEKNSILKQASGAACSSVYGERLFLVGAVVKELYVDVMIVVMNSHTMNRLLQGKYFKEDREAMRLADCHCLTCEMCRWKFL